MGHENHAGMSPAHRRNQNPVSPSASLLRRSSTFSREETDLSWMALIRRHRFLLLMLALLILLCTIYLYFAIKLGADNCSSLSGKEEALCRLRKSKIKASHGHKATRGLLSVQESTIEILSQNHDMGPEIQQKLNAVPFIEYLSEDGGIQSVLSLGCTGRDLTEHLKKQFTVSKPGLYCEEMISMKEKIFELLYGFLQMGLSESSTLFDLIVCEHCNMPLTDQSIFWKLNKLLRHGGFFLWISESLSDLDSNDANLPLANMELHGWSCLSRGFAYILHP